MTQSKHLRCFVAMALGHADTDLLYDKYVEPAIKAAGLFPVRVDILVHNDRIDERIRKEIGQADVMIADLTYARPSVYWEAGYGEKSIPVVYLCREDHFTPKAEDPYGNLAIHFDLRNANIIAWGTEGQTKFKKTLISRLKLVTKEKREKLEILAERSVSREEFAQLAEIEQKESIFQEARSCFQKAGYTEIDMGSQNEKLSEIEALTNSLLGGQQTKDFWISSTYLWKTNADEGILAILHACSSKNTRKEIAAIAKAANNKQIFLELSKVLPDRLLTYYQQETLQLNIVHIFPTIGPQSQKIIHNVLETWRPLQKAGWYYKSFTSSVRLEVLIIDKLLSIIDLQNNLDSIIPLIDSTRRRTQNNKKPA